MHRAIIVVTQNPRVRRTAFVGVILGFVFSVIFFAYSKVTVQATVKPVDSASHQEIKGNFSKDQTPVFLIDTDGAVISTTKAVSEGPSIEPGQGKIETHVFNSAHNEVTVPVQITPDTTQNDRFLVVIDPQQEFTPGKYTLKVNLENSGDRQEVTQDFTWGVLAVNVNQSTYKVDESVGIGLGVLDDAGRTLCDAKVSIKINPATGPDITLSTEDKTIVVAETCQDKLVTNLPDYGTSFTAKSAGTYRMNVTAETSNGTREMTQIFEVTDAASDAPFVIKRHDTATRIYPLAQYTVKSTVVMNQSFIGSLTEKAPTSFEITDATLTLKHDGVAQSPLAANITKDDKTNIQLIRWDRLNVTKGDTAEITYSYQAPPVSPEFYLLGPIEISNDIIASEDTGVVTSKTIFTEPRAWQIASDETGSASSSRLRSVGFELQSTTGGVEYQASTGSPAITTTSGQFRSGAAALDVTTTSGTAEGMEIDFATVNTADGYYMRAYIYLNTIPNANTSILEAYDSGNTVQTSIQLKADGTLQLCNIEDDATCATPTLTYATPLTTGIWYRIELKADSTTLATTKVNAKVDGVAFGADGTVNHANGIMTYRVGFMSTTHTNSPSMYIDDLAINNDSSTDVANGNWPGEGKVVHLRPNADVATETWQTGASANCVTGGVDCFALVDEVTPDDGASNDFIKSPATCSTTSHQIFDLISSSTAGIGANDTIRLAQANARLNKAGSQAQSALNIALLDGANVDTATFGALANGVYNTNDNSATTANPILSSFDRTGTATTHVYPWTVTTVDSMQIRVTPSGTDCAPVHNVATLWVTVEYVAVTGGRLFSSGFENQSITAGMEWTGVVNTPAIDTITKRTGAAALRATGWTASTGESVRYNFAAANSDEDYYARTYFRYTTLPGINNQIGAISNSSGTYMVFVILTTSGQIEIRREGGGVVGSNSSTLSANTWYRIEIKVDRNTGTGDSVVEAKLDGTVFATSSTLSLSTGVDRFLVGGNLGATPNTVGDWYFDDVAINAGVGSTQNSYPGEGGIIHLRPDGNGDTVTWTNTSTNIDETIPNDATDAVTSTTVNQIEEASLSASGLASTDIVNLVSAGVRFNSTSTAVSGFKVRVKDSTAGTPLESDNILANSTTWKTNVDTGPQKYPITAYTRPDSGEAWTSTTLDSAQVGVRETVDTVDTQQVSTLWLLVEYFAPTLVVSGNAYADEATTAWVPCDGAAANISLVHNGGTAQTAFCNDANGSFTFNVTGVAANDPISVFFNTTGGNTDKGVAVTVATNGTTNITLNPRKNIVWVKGESASITNTKLDHCDSAAPAGCANVPYAVTTSNLVAVSGMELHIESSKTYAPGGNVTTPKMHVAGTYTGASETLTLNGTGTGTARPLYLDGGTFTASTNTTIFSGDGDSDIQQTTYNILQLTPSLTASRAYTFTGAPTINGNFDINPTASSTTKTLTVNAAGDITVAAAGTTTITGTTTGASILDLRPSSTDYNLSTGKINITNAGAGGTLDAGSSSSTITLTGTTSTLWTQTGTFTTGTSTVVMNPDAAVTLTSNDAITFYNLSLTPAISTAGRTYTFGTSALTINGDFLIQPSGTQLLTVNPSANISVAASKTTTISRTATATSLLDLRPVATDYTLTSGLLNIATGGTLDATSTTSATLITLNGTAGTLWTQTGTFTITSATSTVVMASDADVTLTSNNAITYYNLTLSPSLTASRAYAFGTSTLTVNNDFLLNPDASSTTKTLTATLGATTNVTGVTTLEQTGTGASNLNTSASGSFALTTGRLDITASGTFVANASTVTLNSTTLTGGADYLVRLDASGTLTAGTSTFVFNPDISLTGGDTMTSGTFSGTGKTFYNIQISPAMSASRTYDLSTAAITTTGDFNIVPTATAVSLTLTANMGGTITLPFDKTLTVDAGDTNSPAVILDTRPSTTSYNITAGDIVLGVGSAGGVNTLDATSAGSTITVNGVVGTGLFVVSADGDFIPGNSTVQVTSATSSPSFMNGTETLNNLTINANATVINLGTSVTIGNNLTITNGVFNANAPINGPGASGTLTIGATGTFCLGGTSGASNATCDSGITQTTTRDMPAFAAYTFNASSTVRYLTDVAQTIDGTPAYGNLILSPKLTADRAYDFEASTAPVINGAFTIQPTASTTTKTLTVNTAGNVTVATTRTTTISGSGTGVSILDLRPVATDYNLTTGGLTIGTGSTLDGTGAASAINVAGNYANSGIFTAGSSTVTLNGTSTQGLSGNMTTTSAFNALTITNSSGSVSGCATSFTAGVDFAGAATINTYTIATSGLGAGVYVEYASGATYTVPNISWVGTNTKNIYFRNSNLSSGTWGLVYTPGTASVSYVNVARSNSTGTSIPADDGTSTDCLNNTGWNFTAPTITVAGTVYKNDESTAATTGNGGPCDSSTAVVSIRVNGGTAVTGSCSNSDGTFSIASVSATAGQTIAVYLTSSMKANTIYLSDGTSDTGINLYENHVAVGHVNAGPAIITDLDAYDNDQNATDMLFDAEDLATDTLDVESGKELYIRASETFAPGGTVTTDRLHIKGTYTGASEVLTLAGFGTGINRPLYIDGGTFTSSSNTTKFTGNGTVEIESGAAYNNLQLMPVITTNRTYNFGGTALNINGNFDINPTKSTAVVATLTVRLGASLTVAASKTTTVTGTTNGASILDTTTNNYAFSTGLLNITNTGGAGTFTANGSTVTLTGTSGTLLTNTGTFTAGTSTVVMNPDAAVTLTSGTFTFYNLQLTPTITANRTYSFSATAAATINGNFDVIPTSTGANTLTVNMGTGSITVASSNTTTLSGLGAGPATGKLNLNGSSGLLITGNLAINNNGSLDGSSGSITITGTGTPFTNSGIFTYGTSTVRYSGDGNVTVLSMTGSGGTNGFYNLSLIPTISTNRTYTFAGAEQINGTALTIQPSATAVLALTVNMGGHITAVAGATTTVTRSNSATSSLVMRPVSTDYNLTTGKINIATGGTLDATGAASIVTLNATSSTLWTQTGTFTPGSSTVVMNPDAAVTLISGTVTFNNFQLTPTITTGRTYTLNSGPTVNGNFDVQPTSAGTNTLTVNLSSGVTVASNKTTTIDGLGAGPATGLISQSTGTLSTGALTINTQGSLNGGSSIISLSGSGTPFTRNGTFIYSTSRVEYKGDGDVTVLAMNGSGGTNGYYDLYLNPFITNNRIYTMSAGVTQINNNLNITPNGGVFTLTVNMGGDITVATTTTITRSGNVSPSLVMRPVSTDYNLTTGRINITTGSTLDATGAASTIILNATSVTLWTQTGTFNAGSSTVIMNPDAAVTTTSGNANFNNLQLTPAMSASRTYTFGSGAITVNGDFDIKPTATSGSLTHTVNMGAAITVASNKTLTIDAGNATNNPSVNLSTTSTNYALSAGNITIANTGSGTKNLTANGSTITLTGTGTPFTRSGTFTYGTSTVAYTNATSATILAMAGTAGTNGYYNLQTNGAGTYTLGGATTITNNLLISAGTLDVDNGGNYALIVNGNYTNSGTFTARAGTVTLSGATAQTLSGTMTGGSAFYNLTISNNSGANLGDCELTGFTASVVFGAAATSTNNYTITTASTRVQYLSGATYTFNNINWNGQAGATKIFFRNSAASGTWLLKVTGTQTAVSNVNVSRSDASVAGGSTIVANDGTNTDCGNNTNWTFTGTGFAVRGNAYADEAGTPTVWASCDGSTTNISLAINGIDQTNVSCSASDGSFAFTSQTISSGNVVTVWFDGVSDKATTYTKATTSPGDITGLVLTKNRIRISNNGAGGLLTNTNINTYDTDQDGDIPFSSSNGTAISLSSGTELHIETGATFAPGGNVTAPNMHVAGTYTGGSETVTLTGIGTSTTCTDDPGTVMPLCVSGTFTPTSNTVLYSGDGALNVAGGLTYNTLHLKPTITTGRTYTFSTGAVVVNGNFDIIPTSAGANTLTVNMAGTITVASSGTTTLDGLGAGPATGLLSTNTTNNLTTGSLTINTQGSLTAGSATVTLSGTGTPLTRNGTFTYDTSTVEYAGDGAVTVTSMTGSGGTNGYYNLSLTPTITAARIYTFGGVALINGTAFTIQPIASTAQALTVNMAGDITVAPGGTTTISRTTSATSSLVMRPVSTDYNLTTGKINVAIGGTLDATGAASIITLNSTTSTLFTRGGTFTAGSTTVIMNPDAAVTLTSGTITFNNLQLTPTITSGRTYTFGTGAITINGDFDVKPTASTAITLTVNMASGGIAVASNKTTTVDGLGAGPATGLLSLNGSNTLSSGAITINTQGSLNGSSGTVALTGTGTPLTRNGTFTYSTSTVRYTGDGAVTVASMAGSGGTNGYFRLSLIPTITNNRVYTLAGAIQINDTVSSSSFNINPTASSALTLTVNMGGDITAVLGTTIAGTSSALSSLVMRPASTDYNLTTGALTINTGGTLDATGAASTITVNSTTTSTALWQQITGSFISGSSTVVFNPDSTPTSTLTSGAITFNNLQLTPAMSVSRTYSFGSSAITVNGDFDIKPTATAGSLTHTVNMGAGITVASNKTLTIDAGNATNNPSVNLTTTSSNHALSAGNINIANTGSGTKNLTANASTITLTGTGTPFTRSGIFTYGTSTVTYTNATSATILAMTGTAGTNGYYNLQTNGAGTYTLGGTTTVNNNVTISAGTLDADNSNNYGLTVTGNWANPGGTFAARAGAVTLNGTTTKQTLSGIMTGSSAFYNLTATNSSGTDATDCERNNFTAGISFAAAATATNDLTFTTASSRVEFNSGSTYTFTNINWNGQAAPTRTYFRNSTNSGTWLLKVTGTQTAVSYLNVSRSDASVAGGSTIVANNGTNIDCGNNTNWTFSSAAGTITVSGNAYANEATTVWANCNGSTANISLVVNGGSASTAACNASTGAFSFNNITANQNDPVSVFFNTTGGNTDKGVAITMAVTAPTPQNIVLNPRKDIVWTQNEVGGGAPTNTTLDHCDSVSPAGCANVPYSVTTGALTIPSSTKLAIGPTSNFIPNGDVTTPKLHIYGTYTGGTETLTLNGTGTGTARPLFIDAGTFISNSNTTQFTGDGDVEVDQQGAYNVLQFTPTLATANRTYTFTAGAVTINGNWDINPTASSTTKTLTVNPAGNITVASSGTTTITGTTTGASVLDLRPASTDYNLSTGKINITNTGSGGTLDAASAASTITLTGTAGTLWTQTGTYTITSGTSTVVMNPDAAVTLTSNNAITFYNLSLTPAISTTGRTYTFGTSALTINGNLLIQPSGSQLLTVNMGANISVDAAKTTTISRSSTATSTLIMRPSSTDYDLTTGLLNIASGGTLNATGAASTITITGTGTLLTLAGTFTAGSSTVVMNPDAAVTLTSGAITFNNLQLTPTITTARTYTFGTGTTTINGNFDVKPTSSSANTLTVSNGTGTITVASNKITTIDGLGAGPAVGLVSLGSSITFTTGTLTINNNGSLSAGNTRLLLTGTGSAFTNSGTFTYGTSTVQFTGDGDTTIPAMSGSSGTNGYYTLMMSPTITADRTYSFTTGAVQINGTSSGFSSFSLTMTPTASSTTKTLTVNMGGDITSAGTINISGATTGASKLVTRPVSTDYNITTGRIIITNIGGGGTLDATGSASLITTNSTGTLWTQTGTFVPGSSTVIMNPNAAVTLTSDNAITFYNLHLTPAMSASRIYTFGTSALTVNNNFDIKPTATTTSLALTVNPAANMTVAGTTTIQPGATNSPTATLDLRPVSTDYNLTTGGLAIESNATLDAASSASSINVSGNYTNNGTFTAGLSTVTLNGTATQTLSGALTSANAFYNLTITNSYGTDASDNELTSFVPGVIFGAAATSTNNYAITTPSSRVQYLSGATYNFANVNWNGGDCATKIYFRNSAASGSWLLNVSGTQTAVSYINVSRSDATGSGATIAATYSTNATNNTNWSFNTNCAGGSATFNQVNYRFGSGTANNISYSGAPAENAALTVSTTGQDFRLRMAINVGTATLTTSGQDFKLRFGEKPSGGCSAATYADVATGAGVIRYVNLGSLSDGDNISSVGGDPNYTGTEQYQDYEEANNFTNSVSAIASGENGVWDFSLENFSSVGSKRYCFKVTKSDGSDIDTYTNYPEIIIDEELTFNLDATSKNFGTITPGSAPSDQTSTLTTTTNAASGYQITMWQSQLLTRNGGQTIANWTGTNGTPTTLSGAGASAFGYTTNDSNLAGGTANRFTSASDLFAGFASSGPGDIVADNTSTPVIGDTYNVTYRLRTSPDQASGTYNTTLIYINTATY